MKAEPSCLIPQNVAANQLLIFGFLSEDVKVSSHGGDLAVSASTISAVVSKFNCKPGLTKTM